MSLHKFLLHGIRQAYNVSVKEACFTSRQHSRSTPFSKSFAHPDISYFLGCTPVPLPKTCLLPTLILLFIGLFLLYMRKCKGTQSKWHCFREI